jgi:hypothetical protein
MKTEEEHVLRAQKCPLSLNHGLGQLSWTPIGHENQLTVSAPSERYLHSCAALNGKLYVLGGANN